MNLDDLIVAARDGGDAPSPTDRERVRVGVARMLAETPRARGMRQAFRSRPVMQVAFGLITLCLLVGTASAFAWHRRAFMHPTLSEVVTADRVVEAPHTVAVPPKLTSSETVLPDVLPSVPITTPTGERKMPRPASSLSPDKSSLAEEMAAVESARTALHEGDAKGALSALDRYDREYRHGTLRQEAAALRIFALCDAGRPGEARTSAATFRRIWPHAPMNARFRSSCVGDMVAP